MLGTSHRRPIGLYAWDEVGPEESALGFLLRMAEENGHPSTDSTVMDIGVRRAGIARGVPEHINRLAAEARTTPAALLAYSPVLRDDDKLVLRGHVVDKYLHFGVRRLCPGCIAESNHHRFWWDLVPVSMCPRHRLELVGACPCGAELGWRDGGVSICTDCGAQDRYRFERRPAEAKVLRSDAYILSRFGVGSAETVQVLDSLPMADVFKMLERVGSACEGYSREWRSAKSLGISLSVVQARGFEVLADGKMDEVLTRIFDGYINQGGKPEHGFSKCYGWLYHWFNHKRGVKFSPLLAEAIHLHGAARFPVTPKAHLAKIPENARRKLSLKAAAAKAETSVFAMKNIGLALGLIRTEKLSGSQLSFSVEDVDRIAHDLKGALSFEETMQRLGIGRRPLREMMENGSLVPALEGGGKRHAYVFRPMDVDGLLRKLAGTAPVVSKPSPTLLAISRLGKNRSVTIAHGVRLVLDGKVLVRERMQGRDLGLNALFIADNEALAAVDPTHHKMRQAATEKLMEAGELVPFSAAAKIMRLNARGLRRAIEIGLFSGVEKGASALPPKHVDAFARKFIMMGEIKARVGGYFPTLKDQIERAGFKPDKQLTKCLNSGYLRAEVEPFLKKLKQGAVSLDMPPPARNAVIQETRRILENADHPIETKEVLSMLRKKEVRLGPSDKDQFFYATMNEEKNEFVYLVGAGWWLRQRAFMGHIFPADRETPSYHNLVDEEIVAIVRQAKCPMMPDDIVASLAKRRIAIASSDPVVYLRRMAIRRPEIVRFHGKGYWDSSRAWAPARYFPKKVAAAA
jgi:TniQ